MGKLQDNKALLLAGNDAFLQKLYIDKYKEEKNIGETHLFNFKDFVLKDFLIEAKNFSFFSKKILWIVYSFDKISIAKLKSIDSKLINIFSNLIFSHISEDYWKILKQSKDFKNIRLIELSTLNSLQFRRWVISKFNTREKKITNKVLLTLENLYRIENQLNLINGIIEKVCIYFFEKEEIKSCDLEKFLNYSIKENPLNFFKTLKSGNLKDIFLQKEKLISGRIHTEELFSKTIWQIVNKSQVAVNDNLIELEHFWKTGRANSTYLFDLYLITYKNSNPKS
jgi:hypothetical protein